MVDITTKHNGILISKMIPSMHIAIDTGLIFFINKVGTININKNMKL